jgi:hypothetical protein
MYCDRFTTKDGVYVVCCRSGRRPSCSVPGCGAPSEFQCDFPLSGKKRGRTCSKHLCAQHRVRQPTIVPLGGETIDYCPAHDRIAKGQQP